MDQIEELKRELSILPDGNYDESKLIDSFSNDNLLFKRILKIIFLGKLLIYFNPDLKKSDSIELYFPRKWRREEVKEFEEAINLEAPKMTLSNPRINILLASFAIPLISFLVIFFFQIEYLLIPASLLGFGIYIFLATLPAIMIGLIFPRFFNPLDWPEIKDVDDFLDFVVIRNWEEYRKDSFSKTLIELKKMNLLI